MDINLTFKIFSIVFSNPFVVIIFSFMPLMIVAIWVFEDWEYKKTYAKLPRFMWPPKSWWKDNKGYAQAMMERREQNE